MKRLNLIHLGIGNVGKSLVKQILEQKEKLKKPAGVDLNYCGLYNSKEGIFNPMGISDDNLIKLSFSSDNNPDIALKNISLPFILIDTTASDQTYPFLLKALKGGGSIVMSNKKPLASSQNQFDKLQKLGKGRIFYETTVGAALPVISTLKDLIDTGDQILGIQGCFSGTLGFIFSRLEEGLSFSTAVKEAKASGFTEPDPRDDLSGLDVARKALILVRTVGKKLELHDINLQSLYPPNMQKLSVDEFMKEVNKLDGYYQKKMAKARDKGMKLRFMAKVTGEKCSVGLKEVEKDCDLGNLKGPDNMIVFKTKRYRQRPLVIKGPGAGAEITASGVFADILKAGKERYGED